MSYLRLRITRKKSGDFMAKNKDKKKEKELEQNDVEERSPGIFQKIFILGVIPLLFIITVLLIISMFTSFNVFEKAKDLTSALPFISKEENTSSANNAEKVVSLQAQIKEKEAELEKLKADLEKAAADNDTLVVEQERLQFEIDKLKREQQQAEIDFAEILATYEKMDPTISAPVIVKMNETEALRILTNLKPKTLADILSNMKAEEAAKYTELMAKQ